MDPIQAIYVFAKKNNLVIRDLDTGVIEALDDTRTLSFARYVPGEGLFFIDDVTFMPRLVPAEELVELIIE